MRSVSNGGEFWWDAEHRSFRVDKCENGYLVHANFLTTKMPYAGGAPVTTWKERQFVFSTAEEVSAFVAEYMALTPAQLADEPKKPDAVYPTE